MRVLALDTTTQTGSVALVEDDRVIAERAGDPLRSHAERLPGDLIRALGAAGWPQSSVDVYAVVAGPGSFTGLRIGIASMQGMAFVHGKPLAGVSALEALAHVAAAERAPGTRVAAWIDAHRREVYAALYEVADAQPFTPERLLTLQPPSVGDPGATLQRWREAGSDVDVFTGDGAVAYAALFGGAELAVAPLLAGAAGRIAAALAARGQAGPPARVHPLYIRRPDAEVARERVRQPQ